ncbi:hypothetical protein RRSWK_04270 [Rhodopirellula sp. SWK7]|nr:hypothetical protein RRSWK_04270 [Rhodopirellula sp. SWK7]
MTPLQANAATGSPITIIAARLAPPPAAIVKTDQKRGPQPQNTPLTTLLAKKSTIVAQTDDRQACHGSLS